MEKDRPLASDRCARCSCRYDEHHTGRCPHGMTDGARFIARNPPRQGAIDMRAWRFILWDRKDGSRPPIENGEIITSGCVGRVDMHNAVFVGATWPPLGSHPSRLSDLEVGACVYGVRFSASGETGTYDVYRVE